MEPVRRAQAAQADKEEGGDRLAAQTVAHAADVVETAVEHLRALAGAAARLAEARATHARMVADLEARAERAAKEEGARQARERVFAMDCAQDRGAAEHWPELERQPWALAACSC